LRWRERIIEIQGNRRSVSRLASISSVVTQFERSQSCLSPVFPLSVHGVAPNPHLICANDELKIS
jgi:hypothetical protein